MRSRPLLALLVLLVVVGAGVALALAATDGDDEAKLPATTSNVPVTEAPRGQPSTPPVTVPAEDDFTLLVAGDIASCQSRGDEATAAILDAHPTPAIATLGDNVYDRGTTEEFAECYEPTWGRHRQRTRPAVGNHEYGTPGAAPYFDYFGEAAGARGEGWYAYDVGPWRAIVLNSNCRTVPCGTGSPQERWLREELATNPARCTLAYFHHPRFTSAAGHGSTPFMGDLYATMYEGGVDVVLAGHDHVYERLAPLDPAGNVDPDRGIRNFVVGTGGRSNYGFLEPITGTEVRKGDVYGVLGLHLGEDGYEWEFLPVEGDTFADTGSGTCH